MYIYIYIHDTELDPHWLDIRFSKYYGYSDPTLLETSDKRWCIDGAHMSVKRDGAGAPKK